MLEPASETDHPAIVALVNRAYRGASDVRSWNTEAHLIAGDRVTLDQLRRDLGANPDARLMVHRPDQGGLLACVWIEPETAQDWYFGMLAIDPADQAKGLGQRMLAAIEAFVRDRGGRRIRITVVNRREPLIAWYERHGFARTGETEPFPYEDKSLGLPLRDDLAFVILAKAVA